MATPQYFNSTQNFPKPYKKLKGHSRNSGNGVSSWAFLFSIFIYISIFYIFNLSPSSLLNTTKFWFFLSNTLILIIAVDSGAFSSSNEPQQIQVRAFSNSYELPNMELAKKNNLLVKDDVGSQEKIKEVVFVQKRENPGNKFGIVAINGTEKPIENSQEKVLGIPQNAHYEARDHQEKRNEGNYFRSKSEKLMIRSNEKKLILRRTESENKREMMRREEEEEEDQDEFSSMSDEELNRRVEEFIQKFNRQIRLQALAGKLQ